MYVLITEKIFANSEITQGAQNAPLPHLLCNVWQYFLLVHEEHQKALLPFASGTQLRL